MSLLRVFSRREFPDELHMAAFHRVVCSAAAKHFQPRPPKLCMRCLLLCFSASCVLLSDMHVVVSGQSVRLFALSRRVHMPQHRAPLTPISGNRASNVELTPFQKGTIVG